MLVKDLPLPEKALAVLSEEAETLNPPQELAIKAGLLEGKNIVVAAPTASGKTLIAEMAFLRHFLSGGKSVYLVPLKALGSEKYDEFKKRYEKIGMKVAISVGDMDSEDMWLRNYDLIIASNEKMDSLLRHRAAWVRDLTLVISDEVHLLDDSSRGPTLEMVLTRLRAESNAQILALSATIKNASEIAGWLSAELVKSDYRPVKLRKGVFLDNCIHFDKEKIAISNTHKEEFALCRDTLDKEKQALVFVSTRRSAEAEAEKIAGKIPVTNSALEKIASDIEHALPSPTKQCRRLATIVRKGSAFHHAGLVAKQRKLIEDNFRSGKIKFITATTSLAFGLNLPASRVIVRDTKRYTKYGMDFIPNIEIQQMFGRAGRPRYDKEGEAILLAKSEAEKSAMEERYINGETENIYSKLSVEPVLRMHVLALVASNFATSKSQLRNFFSKTFFAHQYGDIEDVMTKIEKVLRILKDFGFIKSSGEAATLGEFMPAFELNTDPAIEATALGKRVAELYIDPLSASHLIKNVQKKSALEYLMAINHCAEMMPLLRVRQKEAEDIEVALESSGLVTPDAWDMDYEDFLGEFKTSLMFLDWMDEIGEDALLEKYGAAPGEIHAKKTNAGWMLYAARELAMTLGDKDAAKEINKARLRVVYGVREDLLRLVLVKGIGRSRARKLHRNGIRGMADIKNNTAKVAEILGTKITEKIMQEISRGRYSD
ncbi:MAG: DEAD/DEAH box helicase [Candidatus Aenigmarchaeota archaeon]|nr:DEAD/DEAH box helicase [Candidatus Aenigmarchaeota archaeon]